jgi:YVTN family beta-propeller protein
MSEQSPAPDQAARRRRRRLGVTAGAVAAGLVVLGIPVTTLALSGSAGTGQRPAATPNAAEQPVGIQAGRQSDVAPAATPTTTGAATDYHAFISFAGAGEVAEVDTATDTVLGAPVSADTTEGVAVTPDGSQIFAAQTGQFSVVAVNPATKAKTTIEVGAYPQDVAITPNGQQVYATVTGGDTGPGGSNQVAVISVATDAVIGDITVSSAPRQVAFSPDGALAYVTTETSIAVISTATGKVVRVIPDRAGSPQGIAVSPDGKTLYVSNPDAGTVSVIRAATGSTRRLIKAGAEPYDLAITPDGATLYVPDMNADAVVAISTATGKIVATMPTGLLPGSVGVVPDGSQVWVGNVESGSVTVINPATNTVSGTITFGAGTSPLDGVPFGMAFVPAASS